MCRLGDIHCRLINGCMKLTPPNQGCIVVKGYRWCAVYVRQSWRFVDLEGGANGIFKSKDPDEENTDRMARNLYLKVPKILNSNGVQFRKFPKGKEKPKVDLDTNGYTEQRVREYFAVHDYYFLTNPHEFIYDHFPDEEQWQLLARKVTSEEFNHMVALKWGFFKPFYDTDHPKHIIKAFEGNLSLQFKMETTRSARIAYNLTKMKGGKLIQGYTGLWNDYVYAEDQGVRKLVKLSLPEIGLYQLDLYSFDSPVFSGVGEEPRLVATYVVECDQPSFKSVPNPTNPRYEYGPGDEMQKLGIEAVSHHGGTITAREGLVEILFRCEAYAFQFSHVLEALAAKKEHLAGMSCHYHDNQNGGVSFLVKLPTEGKYLFKIYCRVRDSSDPFYNVCNYLIVSDMGCADMRPYPPVRFGEIGQLLDTPECPVVAESHVCPVIWPSPGQSLALTMGMTCSEDVLDMQLSHYDYQQETSSDMSDFIWKRVSRKKKLLIEVRFPKPGIYSLFVHGTEVVRNGLTIQDYFIYVLIVDHPSSPCLAFPIAQSSWMPRFTLFEPKHRKLTSNTIQRFKVQVG